MPFYKLSTSTNRRLKWDLLLGVIHRRRVGAEHGLEMGSGVICQALICLPKSSQTCASQIYQFDTPVHNSIKVDKSFWQNMRIHTFAQQISQRVCPLQLSIVAQEAFWNLHRFCNGATDPMYIFWGIRPIELSKFYFSVKVHRIEAQS